MITTVLAFLLTLGILVVIHEYGHYRVAVACGVKVLRFSVGFGRVLWRRVCTRDGAARDHAAPDRARNVARLSRDNRRIGLAKERAPRPVSRAALVPASGTTQGRNDPGS